MNWYIGQEIVCVNSKGAETTLGTHSGLKEGATYKIIGLESSCCYIRIDIGFRHDARNQICSKCYSQTPSNGKWLFDESRFRPLDELCNISELTEILEATKPFEII